MSPDPRFVALGAAAVVVGAAGVWIVRRLRVSPGERERRRRRLINETGRLTDGVLTDVEGEVIYFSYTVGGVEYTASQDVSGLGDLVPADRSVLVGPVMLKYLPRSPANSIVVCEAWSGLRSRLQKQSYLKQKREVKTT